MYKFILTLITSASVAFSLKLPHPVDQQVKEKLEEQGISYSYELLFDSSKQDIDENAFVQSIEIGERQRFDLTLIQMDKQIILKGKVQAINFLPVLKAPIAPGTIIEETHIEWIAVPIERFRSTQANTLNDLVGKTPSMRVLQPKEIISKHELKAPIIIAKGTLVSVVYEHGALSISARGIAQKDGALGEIIPFKRVDSQKTFEATVIGPSKAELPSLHMEG